MDELIRMWKELPYFLGIILVWLSETIKTVATGNQSLDRELNLNTKRELSIEPQRSLTADVTQRRRWQENPDWYEENRDHGLFESAVLIFASRNWAESRKNLGTFRIKVYSVTVTRTVSMNFISIW
jgi:hypothetical protein